MRGFADENNQKVTILEAGKSKRDTNMDILFQYLSIYEKCSSFIPMAWQRFKNGFQIWQKRLMKEKWED